MSKKPLEDDLLTGASLSKDKDKKAKKAEKLAKKNAKVKEKNEAKRSKIKAQLDKLKEEKETETDEKKLEKINAQITKLSDKYSSVGSSTSLAPRTLKIVKSTICIVIVIALLVTYVATGAVRKGFIASLGIPAQYFTAITVSNGDQKAKIKVSTYNFYFASTYNRLQSQKSSYEQYGIDASSVGLDVDFDKKLSSQTYTDSDTKETMTWAEHINQLVLDSIESTYTYYLAAVAANDGKDPEITDDQKDELSSTLKEYKETANKYGYTLSGYLVQAMGKGVTESVFRTETTRQYIAQNYQSELSDNQSKATYTDKEIAAYKDEHLDELKTVDIKEFECSTEDDAKAFAKALKSDGSNFADLCVKYSSSDFDKKAYADDTFSTELGVTRSTLTNKNYAIATADEHTHESGDEDTHTYSGLDWLFSSDRKAGDIKQYSTSVVYVITPAKLSDTKTVNVRHILIAPETSDSNTSATDATDAQWKAAYKKAKNLLDKFNSGKKTDDAFATLAKENSGDTGSTDNGGLYENVITGQMVNSFSNWCFDSSRKAGDTGIAKSEYGYHIMYFVKTNDQKVWEYSAQQALANADSTDATKKLEDSYKLKTNWFGSRYFEKDIDISR